MTRNILVGLSGGVDSAVSAALLKEQGHEVIGCFIKIWQPEFIECTWREDRLDAMRVASALGIPFREVDLSNEYKREVVDRMIADYARGITPNPDVLCNSSIKFGRFLGWARKEGADFIATGHYARIDYERLTKSFILQRGKDNTKDQSYFLWQLGQEELSRSLFPIGDLTKQEVRSLAKKFKLPNANKPDSQGLCFVGDVSMEDFLARFIPLASGVVLDTQGHAVGKHRGAALYTIGQRHGFTAQRPNASGPRYVVSVNTSGNTVTVSQNRSDAERKKVFLEQIHWIERTPSFPLEVRIQARYRETPILATIQERDGGICVSVAKPHLFSAGQSVVMYDDGRCLGGGIVVANMG